MSEWDDVFKALKEKIIVLHDMTENTVTVITKEYYNHQSCSSAQREREIMSFPEKNMREFITIRSALQEIVKVVLDLTARRQYSPS